MNAVRTTRHPATARTSPEAVPFRLTRRERDYGVGYGTSSGYAAANDHRYAKSWAKTYFRCS
ncbi:MAG: hypothetical protein JSS44_08165 [Proteobacteria bacterium]|nr:hypothetical protein [Pseudomonadota bacterium]MBS0460959.1 hypothetical protein [Pseudomonadota bacterium]